MSYRSYSASDGNESNYHGENMEYRKKVNKIKNYQSRKKDNNFKKHTNTYEDSSHTNHERSSVTSGGDYSNSKTFSRKSGQHYQRDYSNIKNKSKHHDSDYDTKYRVRKDFDNEHSNSEKQRRKSKANVDKIKVHRKPSHPGKYITKSKISGNSYSGKKFPKGKNLNDYSEVDYHSDRGNGEEGEYYNSEDYNTSHKDEYDRSSGMGHESGELSESDEETPEPKSISKRKKKIIIVTRSMWDLEPGNPEADKLPQKPFNHINYVDTNSPICLNQEECIEVLRSIKERDQSIKHNFYIGGDSVIYEGKGWVADKNEDAGFRKRSVDVAFIGTYSVKKFPKPTMLTLACDFVYYCITSKTLYQNFTCTIFKEHLPVR